jgi:hypothetical protein
MASQNGIFVFFSLSLGSGNWERPETFDYLILLSDEISPIKTRLISRIGKEMSGKHGQDETTHTLIPIITTKTNGWRKSSAGSHCFKVMMCESTISKEMWPLCLSPFGSPSPIYFHKNSWIPLHFFMLQDMQDAKHLVTSSVRHCFRSKSAVLWRIPLFCCMVFNFCLFSLCICNKLKKWTSLLSACLYASG